MPRIVTNADRRSKPLVLLVEQQIGEGLTFAEGVDNVLLLPMVARRNSLYLKFSYNPEHLIQRILASKAVIEGERKQVTVLFADLRGSMELIADHDPEDARNILDPVLALIMDAVHRYEGTVNQLMGDGLMALFGAPIAHEDHAVRACHSALRI